MNEIERYEKFQTILSQYKKGQFTTSTFYKKVRGLFWVEIPKIDKTF